MKTSPSHMNLPNEERVRKGGNYILSGLDNYVIVNPIALP